MFSILLLLVTFSAVFRGTCGDEHGYRLTKYLLSNYETSVRPVGNSSEPIVVVFGLSIHHIIDVDEKNQILTVNCWLSQVWNDTHLTWNASDFGGIDNIALPYDRVWRPDIILYNNADSGYNTAVINTNVLVSHTGTVTWLSHGIYKSSCNISVEYFPFDIQVCKLKWASWTYDSLGLDIFALDTDGDLSNYQENGEFKLESFKAVKSCILYSCCPNPFPDITYYIELRRRPMFYVFNLILPCVLINGIALLVFYVPSESGEKVTLGISALLSMTVFLMTIRESLPPTEKTPLISLYYGVSICLVSFASAMAVVTLNIHHRGLRGCRVPPLIRTIVLGYLAKVVFLRFDEELEHEKLLHNSQDPKSNNLPLEDSTKLGKAKLYPTSAPASGTSAVASSQDYQINGLDVNTTENCENQGGTNGINGGQQGFVEIRGQPELLIGDPPCCYHHHNIQGSNHVTASEAMEAAMTNSLRKRGRTDSHFCNGPTPRQQATMTPIAPARMPLYPQSSMEGILLRLSQSIDKLEKRFVDTDSSNNSELEWKKVSLVVDRVCLLIFFLAMTIASLAILTSSPHIYTASLSDLRLSGGKGQTNANATSSETTIEYQQPCRIGHHAGG